MAAAKEDSMPLEGRPRASTMEAFGNWQGETSEDVPISKRERNDSRAKQEFKLLKEDYESFITLKSH